MKMIQFLSLGMLFFAAQNLIGAVASDHHTINKGDWFIIERASGKKSKNDLLAHDSSLLGTLNGMGEAADTLWESSEDSAHLIESLYSTFKSVDGKFLIKLIDQVLADENIFEGVRKASYKNVTGFLKVVFVDRGWKVRLHVWTPKEEKEHPHNHKWNFYSKIISGHLLQELYEILDDSPVSSTKYSVREPVSLMPVSEKGEAPCPCRDDFVLTSKYNQLEVVNLEIASKDILLAGQAYLMPYHLIHTIVPSKSAISLVFTSRKVRDNSEVFVAVDNTNADIKRHSPSVTRDELRQELLRVKEVLSCSKI